MKKAIVVWGGWDGHEPKEVGEIFHDILISEEFDVTMSDTLESFDDAETLSEFDLIVPIWTMGELTDERARNVSTAVASGTGIAGCHGGMCDAFRNSTLWQFITGGNWVSHPGGDGTTYTVNIKISSSILTRDIEDFDVTSEQYYLHVDPAIEVLATTKFPVFRSYHSSNGTVEMPVVWTKKWGHGRVYYNSLGHVASVMELDSPKELMRRGMVWAAESKRIARDAGLKGSDFED